jgi:hypothetical protein
MNISIEYISVCKVKLTKEYELGTIEITATNLDFVDDEIETHFDISPERTQVYPKLQNYFSISEINKFLEIGMILEALMFDTESVALPEQKNTSNITYYSNIDTDSTNETH